MGSAFLTLSVAVGYSLFFARPAFTASSPALADVKSSVTLLFQNNLNWTDDANHQSFIFLESPLSHAEATSACKSLGEQLLSSTTAKANVADLTPQIRYATFRADFSPLQSFWLADGSALLGLSSLVISPGTKLGGSLPALCTQSSKATNDGTSVATARNTISVKSTSNGNTFTGFRNLKSFRFLGIPYANAPARFEYSSLSTTKNAQVSATAFGPQCFQAGGGTDSEDCLFLNVFTPHLPRSTDPARKLRPVVFWIHGGAFTSGTGSDPTADGGNLASRGDVVVVTINYRLSTIGFLAIPGTDIKGNYGIADQIVALQWVQKNIKTFGGDPSRVTIWGQSAGAGSVRALLSSPKARGLFAAAIPASNLAGYNYATTYSNYFTPAEEFTTAAQAILQSTNCTNTHAAAQLACLKAVPAHTLVTLGTVARYVVQDGTFITVPQLDVTSQGSGSHVPVLWGAMADDGAAFIGFPTPGMNRTTAIASVLPGRSSLVSAVEASNLFHIPFTGNATLDMFNLTARITTDVEFRCLDQATIHSAVRHGIFPKAFYYQFDRSYQTPGFDPNAPVCDAPITATHPFGDPSLPYFKCHSGDLYFQFGTLGQFGLQLRDKNDVPFTQLIVDYWSSFVRTHDPNPDPAYLLARDYAGTTKTLARSGRWEPVTNARNALHRLDFPPRQDSFLELDQCALLGLPITFYEGKGTLSA